MTSNNNRTLKDNYLVHPIDDSEWDDYSEARSSENPWIEVFGDSDEAVQAYWNTH